MGKDHIRNNPNFFNKAIPRDYPGVNGYKEIPIIENLELLVPLGPFSKYRKVHTDSIYFGERLSSPYRENPIEGSNLTVFVRQSLADQLVQMQELLPAGIYVVANDGYRSAKAQKALYERYMAALAIKEPEWTKEELEGHTVNYVSKPSNRRKTPSTHLTGGSTDIVLVHLTPDLDAEVRKIDQQLAGLSPRQSGQAFNLEIDRAKILSLATQLTFATNFDYGKEEAALDYLERKRREGGLTNPEWLALRNTRMLHNTSSYVGLEGLISEWWHKNSRKTQMGAKVAGLPFAEFGPVNNLSKLNRRHERMRRAYLAQTPGWEKTQAPLAEIILP